MKRFTLSKQERLSSRKDIELLFGEGQSLTKYPIRLVWRKSVTSTPEEVPVRTMFSVSKKKFKRAVDRNRVKRLMKESYRMMKPDLVMSIPPGYFFHLGLIYSGNELPDLTTIQKSMALALERWTKKSLQE